ncbi:bcl-2-associated transcription factor 1-like [Stegodyphus dumicola]|uniref:bcl-2-associated transcription factor 1-like n=1 Tax=Stegodyphus dumicola TaxID=202533 RepID=UPI0015B1E95C|nr:bcl-2-associated transcription factor 1-like [Stegodyphus dumicola]
MTWPSPPVGPGGRSSETHAVKVPYDNGRDERYRSGSPDRYASEDKRFAPTLHERFSSVVETNRSEPQVRYSREDLEKITIDIRRNLRDQSPTLRRIMNPSDVKLVRRANEGHRPIFDREEIKQAPRDLREDAHYERKLMSGGGLYNSAHSMDLREVENYEITRHRFDTQHALFSSSSGRTLSDRWQNPELRKESTSLDRDERKREYEMSQITRTFVDLPRSRSRSGDRDFRAERYGGREPIHSRPDYPEGPHRVLGSPPEPRDPIPIHHKSSIASDSRRKLSMKRGVEREHIPPPSRSDSRSRFRSPSERRYPESFSSRERHHSGHHSPGMEFHRLRRSRSRSLDSKLPDFSRRPDKYNYKAWIDKPDITPRGPSYFEHDNREGSDPYRGRGSSRPFRSLRGFRSRGFRGLSRGSMRFRGSFRGYRASSTSPRGRGTPRKGRFSPGLWEHDLYSRSSQDRKSGSLL